MTAPNPDIIEKALDHIADRAGPIARTYGQLYPSAWGRTVRDSAGGSTKHEDGSPSGVSDLLQATAYQRSCITRAGVAILQAVNELHRAQAALDDAWAAIDRTAPPETERHERTYEKPATVAEVKQARKYQDRRSKRADDPTRPWQRDEVTG